jgi:hypothetical protein
MQVMLARLTILFALFHSACITPHPNQDMNTVPKWYTTPVSDNQSYWFDSGVGMNKDEAIRKALSNIASKISVTVNSTFTDILRENRGISESFNESSVEVKTENIHFPGYEIQQIQESQNKVYVFIRVSKHQFINEKMNNFRIKNKAIQNMYSQMKTGHPLTTIKGKNKLNKLISQAMSTAVILSRFNETFAIDKCLKEYMTYQQNIRSILSSLNICIKSDAHSKPVASHIKELLTSENIHVVDQLSNPENAAVIYLKGHQKKMNLDNEYLVKITMDIFVKTLSNRTISNKQHTFSGASLIGYESAIQNAAQEFYMKSKREGIYKTLGLN